MRAFGSRAAAWVPLYLTANWTRPLPNITRAVILVHGLQRNADNDFTAAMRAQSVAGEPGRSTPMIVPQVPTQIDVDAHQLPADMLRWSPRAFVTNRISARK